MLLAIDVGNTNTVLGVFDGPKLVEFNVRFGDPECQVLMLRLGSDIVPYLLACATGTLKDLPAPGAWIARTMFGLPLLTWTVRTEDDRLRALRWADQMIFEGWRP